MDGDRKRVPPPGRGSASTPRRRANGDAAEGFVAGHLTALGWRILARAVRVGRDELDIVALEPGSGPGEEVVVVVEVRSGRSRRFGHPAESVPGGKSRRVLRAALTLRASGRLPDGASLPPGDWRVDLVTVEGDPDGEGPAAPVVRHLKGMAID
jgi:putative endonuclease